MDLKRTVIVALGMLLAMLVPASVAAGQPDQVDPALMQPALNPTFAPWDCWRHGTGIVCDGHRSDSWTNEVTFLECGGRPVYSTGTDVRTLTPPWRFGRPWAVDELSRGYR